MPKPTYDVIVIGGGAAGLTAAGMSAALGAKTLLVERYRTGGDCTWSGCVPSKALLHAAHQEHARNRRPIADESARGQVDTTGILSEIRATRNRIWKESDSPTVLREFGVEYLQGEAVFLNRHSISVVDGSSTRTLTSRFFVVCTGSSPRRLTDWGLNASRLLTTAVLFDRTSLPRSLIVVGGGPVGLEISQAAARLGTRVSLVSRSLIGHLRCQDDADLIRRRLTEDGVRFVRASGAMIVEENGGFRLRTTDGDVGRFEEVLPAIGRTPNVRALGLARAGIRTTERGIPVNRFCRTNVRNIYACGDVTTLGGFTHVAERMARVAVRRMLLKMPYRFDPYLVPRVIFTSPEIATIGIAPESPDVTRGSYEVVAIPLGQVDRARIVGETGGVIRILYRPVSGKILGATIIGDRAGEMIGEIGVAMKAGMSLRQLSETIHAYPTWSLGIRRAADQIYVRSGGSGILRAVGSIFRYRGRVSEKIGSDETI